MLTRGCRMAPTSHGCHPTPRRMQDVGKGHGEDAGNCRFRNVGRNPGRTVLTCSPGSEQARQAHHVVARGGRKSNNSATLPSRLSESDHVVLQHPFGDWEFVVLVLLLQIESRHNTECGCSIETHFSPVRRVRRTASRRPPVNRHATAAAHPHNRGMVSPTTSQLETLKLEWSVYQPLSCRACAPPSLRLSGSICQTARWP